MFDLGRVGLRLRLIGYLLFHIFKIIDLLDQWFSYSCLLLITSELYVRAVSRRAEASTQEHSRDWSYWQDAFETLLVCPNVILTLPSILIFFVWRIFHNCIWTCLGESYECGSRWNQELGGYLARSSSLMCRFCLIQIIFVYSSF